MFVNNKDNDVLFVIVAYINIEDMFTCYLWSLVYRYDFGVCNIVLNSKFVIKCSPYAMKSTNDFIGIICKSNTRQFSVITVEINPWNTLPNTVKLKSSDMSFKKYSLYF